MAAKMVKPPKPKQATCSDCGCTVEYLPEDIKQFSGSCMGDSTGYDYVECPRERTDGSGKTCVGRCIIKGTQW